MAIAHVTFTKYYNYEIEVDDTLYNEDIFKAEETAINEAMEQFETLQRCPIADLTYDEVEIEFE